MKIYTSQFPSVQQFSNQNAFDFLFEGRDSLKRSVSAIIDTETGVKLSYPQLVNESLRYADGLANTVHLSPGSTALIFSPNSLPYVVLLLASLAAGVTISTANAAYLPSELAHQLKESSATVVFVSSDLVSVAKEAVNEVGLSENAIFVLPGVDGKVAAGGLRSYEELRGNEDFKPVKINEKDLATTPAFLPFSSGTTSKPKGVVISHFNMTSVCLQLHQVKGLFDQPEVVIGALPLSHIYGLVVLLYATLYAGGTVALMPRFDLFKFCENVSKYKATVALVVPPICLGLAKHPAVPDYDFSSLRFILSGAAPLSADLQSLLESRLKTTLVLQGYGMSETTSVALLPDPLDAPSGTCGKLLPSMQARLMSEEEEDVKEGEAGELWIRGPNIMVEYLNNQKATSESITSDGWLKTGDVCVITQKGHYTIVDRRKELIKYKGFQVIPSELEAVLLTCPQVADAAVIGVWSEEQATELPRAYVVVESKYVNDKNVQKIIADYVKSKVAAHKRLRGGVIIVDVVPKSPSGKILRKDLRVLAAKETDGKSKL